MDILGRGEFEDNEHRRKITIYSFRRFVKTTMSNQGSFDLSKWWISHSLDADSTYFRQSEKDTIATFRKLESYLTFVDIDALESRRADIESKLEEKDSQISTQREQIGELRDTVAGLSDQLVNVMEEVKKMQKRSI